MLSDYCAKVDKEKDSNLLYTEPARFDGAWEGDVGMGADADQCGYPAVQIYKRFKRPGAIRPIAVIENPDFDEGGQDAGNLALICYAPEMFETLMDVKREIRKKAEEGNFIPFSADLIERINFVQGNIKEASEQFNKEANSVED